MAYRPGSIFHLTQAIVVSVALSGSMTAQNETTQFDQLKAQYKLVKVGVFGGNKAKEPGTLLVVQKEGIFGVGVHGTANPTATYADGVLRPPGKTIAMMSLSENARTHRFQVNEQVYPMKFEINLKADRITIVVVSSDYAYKGAVHFQFPRGSLAMEESSHIQDVISQVLAVDNGGGNTQEAQGQQQPPAPDPNGNQPPAQPQQPPQAQPQTIQLGQTAEEVQAILGQPDKIANIGPKVIYVYRDLKVTFVNGKVTDVQ
jgi:hypothetical protein